MGGLVEAKFAEAGIEPVKDEQGRELYPMTDPIIVKETKPMRDYIEDLVIGHRVLPQGIVASLVSEFENFLARVLRGCYRARPELLRASNRTINIQQLLDIGEVDAVRWLVIDEEIDELLRKGHPEQLQWIEERFGVRGYYDEDALRTYCELAERRNVFVHSDGRVSRQYLVRCRKSCPEAVDGVELGQELAASPSYVQSARTALLVVGLGTLLPLWKKLFPEHALVVDLVIIEGTRELLEEGTYGYAAAERLIRSAERRGHSYREDRLRRMALINLAVAIRDQGRSEESKVLVEKDDWSSCSPDFQLARSVLLEKWAEAATLVRKTVCDGTIDDAAFAVRPIYNAFRETQEFREVYREVFGKEFVYGIERKSETE